MDFFSFVDDYFLYYGKLLWYLFADSLAYRMTHCRHRVWTRSCGNMSSERAYRRVALKKSMIGVWSFVRKNVEKFKQV